jgi:hypothetical protein
LLEWVSPQSVHTNIGHNAGNDDLGAVGGLDGVTELLIVPRIDLALTLNERGVRVHLEDLLGQDAVGA